MGVHKIYRLSNVFVHDPFTRRGGGRIPICAAWDALLKRFAGQPIEALVAHLNKGAWANPQRLRDARIMINHMAFLSGQAPVWTSAEESPAPAFLIPAGAWWEPFTPEEVAVVKQRLAVHCDKFRLAEMRRV